MYEASNQHGKMVDRAIEAIDKKLVEEDKVYEN